MMKGKEAEEIRVMFNIVNDFTPAEEEMIQKDNRWCEEEPKATEGGSSGP